MLQTFNRLLDAFLDYKRFCGLYHDRLWSHLAWWSAFHNNCSWAFPFHHMYHSYKFRDPCDWYLTFSSSPSVTVNMFTFFGASTGDSNSHFVCHQGPPLSHPHQSCSGFMLQGPTIFCRMSGRCRMVRTPCHRIVVPCIGTIVWWQW